MRRNIFHLILMLFFVFAKTISQTRPGKGPNSNNTHKSSNNNDLDDPLGRRSDNEFSNTPPADQSDYMRSSLSASSKSRPCTPQRIQADASQERVEQIEAVLERVLPSSRPSTASNRQAARVQSTVGSIVPPRPAEYTGRYTAATDEDGDGSNIKRYRFVAP